MAAPALTSQGCLQAGAQPVDLPRRGGASQPGPPVQSWPARGSGTQTIPAVPAAQQGNRTFCSLRWRPHLPYPGEKSNLCLSSCRPCPALLRILFPSRPLFNFPFLLGSPSLCLTAVPHFRIYTAPFGGFYI